MIGFHVEQHVVEVAVESLERRRRRQASDDLWVMLFLRRHRTRRVGDGPVPNIDLLLEKPRPDQTKRSRLTADDDGVFVDREVCVHARCKRVHCRLQYLCSCIYTLIITLINRYATSYQTLNTTIYNINLN